MQFMAVLLSAPAREGTGMSRDVAEVLKDLEAAMVVLSEARTLMWELHHRGNQCSSDDANKLDGAIRRVRDAAKSAAGG